MRIGRDRKCPEDGEVGGFPSTTGAQAEVRVHETGQDASVRWGNDVGRASLDGTNSRGAGHEYKTGDHMARGDLGAAGAVQGSGGVGQGSGVALGGRGEDDADGARSPTTHPEHGDHDHDGSNLDHPIEVLIVVPDENHHTLIGGRVSTALRGLEIYS